MAVYRGRSTSTLGRMKVRVVALLVLCSACSLHTEDIPEILRGATAGGGYFGACPPKDHAVTIPLAISPEFNQRLEERFPPGSPQIALSNSLNSVGFLTGPACDTVPEIRSLIFRSNGTMALVEWESDGQGRILWTKGFVAYTSL
jgi:hypothetical protein